MERSAGKAQTCHSPASRDECREVRLCSTTYFAGTGLGGRALEEILQVMIMVDVETTQRRLLPGRVQLSPRVPVFAAAPRRQGQKLGNYRRRKERLSGGTP